MKLWVAIALASLLTFNLAACNREQGAKSGATGSSGQTATGGATGQASEGSTDATKAPKRPASK